MSNETRPVTAGGGGLVAVVIVLVAAAAGIGSFYYFSQREPAEVPKVKKGRNFPEVTAGGWLNSNGAPDTEGKYVLIDLWAPWCGPCLRAMPKLAKVASEFGDHFVVVSVTAERDPDRSSRGMSTREAVDKFEMTWPVGYNAGSFAAKISPGYIPAYWIVDPQGKLVWDGQGEGSYQHDPYGGAKWVMENIVNK